MELFIEWYDDDYWDSAQTYNGEIDLFVNEYSLSFKDDWYYTSITNPLCLPYHGSWISCRDLYKDNKHVGLVYSKDATLVKPLTSKQRKALAKFLRKTF